MDNLCKPQSAVKAYVTYDRIYYKAEETIREALITTSSAPLNLCKNRKFYVHLFFLLSDLFTFLFLLDWRWVAGYLGPGGAAALTLASLIRGTSACVTPRATQNQIPEQQPWVV